MYFIVILLSFVFPVAITFQVDMQEQFVSEGGVHLAGSDEETETFFGTFDGQIIPPWNAESITMLDEDYDGIYSITIDVEANTSYIYKFVNGYIYEFEGGDNRQIDVLEDDIILELSCFNKLNDQCDDIDNSLVEVVFVVDMQEVEVSMNGVNILGANESFTNFGYDIDTLEPLSVYDPTSLNLVEISEDVYSASIYVDPGVDYQYKFVNGNDWDGVEQADRSFIVSEVSGFTLNEVCFGSLEDCPEFTTQVDQLTFKTDVSNAISNNGFELGDMIVVRWGYGETLANERTDTLSLLPFSYTYKIDIDSVMVSKEAGMYYQYYKVIDDVESREVFFNFEYDQEDIYLAERRYFSFQSFDDFSQIEIEDIVDSNVEQRRMPVFLNTNPIGQEVEVTWTLDLSPAYYQIMAGDTLYDIQGIYNVDNVDSLYEWGVWMNGPASMPANGETWTSWGLTLQGTTSKKMWDDGTHGDSIADDHIYTLKLTYDESTQIAQECKFGIKGGDNESSFGLNHYENINVNDPNINVYWGSINPVFYDAWNYDLNQPAGDDECVLMDINVDGIVNVIDIVAVVNIILGSQDYSCGADVNQDGIVNVIDIVSIVNYILS